MGLLKSVGKFFKNVTPVGAILSGVGSLVSSISGSKAQKEANQTNLDIARQNNETAINIARENNEFARQHALEMFDLENSYNDPSEQVRRLTEAGLNPAAMMENVGGAAVGNSSGAGAVSPSMPSLVTPGIEAVPPIATGFLDALTEIANIRQKMADTKKTDVERKIGEVDLRHADDRIVALIDQIESQTEGQNIKNSVDRLNASLDSVFSKSERYVKLRQACADFNLSLLKGETEKAVASYDKALEELTNTKDANEKAQAPIIIENLKKTGQAIDAAAAASRAQATQARAAAKREEKLAEIDEVNRQILEETKDDIVFGRRLANAHQFQDLGEKSVSWLYRFEELKNRKLISDEQYNEIKEAVEHAKKENTAFWWNFAFDKAERISNAVAAYIPLAPERTTVSGGSSRFGSYDATTTHYKVMPWQQ